MHRFIIFDDGLGQLGPMTDLRASFEVRTGMFTTAGRIAARRPRELVGYWVPPRLEALLRKRANAPVNELPREEVVDCLNGRWSQPGARLDLETGEALLEKRTGHVIAARLRRADAEYFLSTGELHERVIRREHETRVLYRFPWDVIALMPQTIPEDIHATRILDAQVLPDHATVVGDEPVEVHARACVWPRVVFDATGGPILVEQGAVLRPHAILVGPCAVGKGAQVLDHALIKANTVIGPHCKVAGEVGATIFQGFANKAHDGHLGDSWVGKWANFGAGTTCSNLLNTYGEITMRVDPEDRAHRTGLQYLGAIVGDHVKLAINTRLGTGTVIGTGAMVACPSFPPATIRRFAWLTERGEQVFRLEKFLETARTVMARRDRPLEAPYAELIRELHERWTG